MTLGLMMRGFVPFSDDVVLVDPEGLQLNPLPRAFHVEEDTWRVLVPLTGPLAREDAGPPGYFVPPQWAVTPVPVGWVLMTEYRPNQAPALLPVPPAQVATALLEQSSSLTRVPRLSLTTARRITEQAHCYRFLVGDPLASVALVQQMTAARERPAAR
jgi:hypothetical protein